MPGEPPRGQDVERRYENRSGDRIGRNQASMRTGGEVCPMRSQGLRKKRFDPAIQVGVVVQEKVKGEEAIRKAVVRTNGTKVQIVNDEEKKQQEAEQDPIATGFARGNARSATAEAVRTRRSGSPQLTFPLLSPRAHLCCPAPKLPQSLGFAGKPSLPHITYAPYPPWRRWPLIISPPGQPRGAGVGAQLCVSLPDAV